MENDIVIRDAYVPLCCADCFAFRQNDDSIKCNLRQIWFGKEDLDWLWKSRPNWCPIEVLEEEHTH